MATYPDIRIQPSLRVVSEEQLDQIHYATLEVLERTGVQLTHPKAREILQGAGARISGDRVHIPSWMVEQAIRTASPRLILGKRNGERSVHLEGNKSYFGRASIAWTTSTRSPTSAAPSSATTAASRRPSPTPCPTMPG